MKRTPGQDAIDLPILRQDEETGEWSLMGSRCPQCSKVFYPGRMLCTDDLATCEELALARRGTLYEAARIDVAPLGFDAPYWVGYVDLEEGARVWSLVDWHGDDDPRHGDTVEYEVRVVRTRDGEDVYGPVFVGPA